MKPGAEAPRISVGLPVHNGERYLAGAIEALLDQTLTGFEIVISDNASTDGTEDICREFAARDSRIRVVRSATNVGASGNFNLVLSLARGGLFKWAAYDDLIAPEFLEKCSAALDAHPEAVLAYARTTLIDEDGIEIGPFPDGLDLRDDSPAARYRRLHRRYRHGGLVNPQYGLIRTDALRRTPGMGSYPGSDAVLIGELAILGAIIEVPDRLFYRRDHPGMTVRSIPSIQGRAHYLDPTQTSPVAHPYLRMAREHLAVVRRASLRPIDRLACTAAVGGFVLASALRYARDRLPGRRPSA